MREERERTRDVERVVRERQCSDIRYDPYSVNESEQGLSGSSKTKLTFHLPRARGLHSIDTDLRVVHVDDIRIPSVVHIMRQRYGAKRELDRPLRELRTKELLEFPQPSIRILESWLGMNLSKRCEMSA